MLTAKGGNKTPVARQLDEAFRIAGWREARYHQTTTTRLIINRWPAGNEQRGSERTSRNEAEGHQVDNVKGRIAVDVEWNAKDGNFDRDSSNFRVLGHAKESAKLDEDYGLLEKLDRQSDDPLKSTTTTNLGQLQPKVQRGDAGGCPLLVVCITDRCFVPPTNAAVEVASTVGAERDNDTDMFPDDEDEVEEL